MELLVLIFLFAATLLLEIKYKVQLYNSMRERAATTAVTFLTISGWELINNHVYKAWLYPGTGMAGIFIFGLPLELYLFALVAPYLGFTVYELLHKIDLGADIKI